MCSKHSFFTVKTSQRWFNITIITINSCDLKHLLSSSCEFEHSCGHYFIFSCIYIRIIGFSQILRYPPVAIYLATIIVVADLLTALELPMPCHIIQKIIHTYCHAAEAIYTINVNFFNIHNWKHLSCVYLNKLIWPWCNKIFVLIFKTSLTVALM